MKENVLAFVVHLLLLADPVHDLQLVDMPCAVRLLWTTLYGLICREALKSAASAVAAADLLCLTLEVSLRIQIRVYKGWPQLTLKGRQVANLPCPIFSIPSTHPALVISATAASIQPQATRQSFQQGRPETSSRKQLLYTASEGFS